MPHVLVAGRIHEAGLTLLRDADGITYDLVDDVSTDSYAPLVANADAVLIRTQPMPASVITEAKRKRPVKAVALTGFGGTEDIERGKQAGFDFHLTKPVDFHELRAVLGQIAA